MKLYEIYESMFNEKAENGGSCLPKISPPNAKIPHLSFSLPSGFTCPFASQCLTKADRTTGKITDIPSSEPTDDFRCFSASQESVYKNVRISRWNNFDALKFVGLTDTPAMATILLAAVEKNLRRSDKYFRIHVGGDFFNQAYFNAWAEVAKAIPDVKFYAYTKSVPYVLAYGTLPSNFIITCSLGGKYDEEVKKRGLKFSVVVNSEEDAANYEWTDSTGKQRKGLKIDHDDSLAYEGPDSFALLIHGTQPAGSKASKAKVALAGKGSYSKKDKLKEAIRSIIQGHLNEEKNK
jgi:hypothetical protein